MSGQSTTNAPVWLSGNGIVKKIQIENNAAALTEELKKRGLLRGLVVIWQIQNVLWGRVEDGRLALADGGEPTPDYWQELRIFNADAELHLTRRGVKLFGRFRSDAENGTAIRYVEASSPLWGVRDKDQSNVPQGYVRLTDHGRNLSMLVPDDVGGEAEQYALVTRNYVEIDEETKQAGYTDYRFVGIGIVDRKGA